MAKNEVATKAQTEVSTGAELDFGAHAGAGMENVGATDVLIPRLGLLQALSPQLNRKKAEYIDGAQIGDIADLGTGETFEAPIDFLPVYFQKVWIEWAPRESGKGLIAIHDDESCLQGCTENDKRQMVTPEGNYIVDTHQFFGLNLSAGGRKCFIPFTSTQIKKAKRLNTLAMSEKVIRPDGSEFTPPLFYRTYKMGSAEESNNQGEWAAWTVERGDKLSENSRAAALFKEAVQFLDALKAGEARADNSDLEEDQNRSAEPAM